MAKRRRSRSRSRHRQRSASKSSDEDGAESQEEVGPEGRVMLLQVENETLKAENRELRKKLMEVLRRKPSRPEAPRPDAPRRSEGPAATPRHSDKPDTVESEAPRRRVREVIASPPREAPKQRVRETVASPPREANKEDDDPPPSDQRNAVLLANDFAEVYNEPIANNMQAEKRGALVAAKLDRFLAHFDDKVQIIDLKSDGKIIKDRKTFKMRYNCVFRESGAHLRCTTHKRFFYNQPRGPTFVLDFEQHDSLVTATPGTRPDGSLGVREARTEHLLVLYEERQGKITAMWVAQDAEKLGLDPKLGEEVLGKGHPLVRSFEAKIAERREGRVGERIFNNYHDIPTVG